MRNASARLPQSGLGPGDYAGTCMHSAFTRPGASTSGSGSGGHVREGRGSDPPGELPVVPIGRGTSRRCPC